MFSFRYILVAVPFAAILTGSFAATNVSHGSSDSTPALARDGLEFKVFQFPRDAMPRIDGRTDDWEMVPDSYVYRTSQLNDTEDGHGTDIGADDIDVKVTVGWVKGLSRLYFRYEARDDFWDFGRFSPRGYLNDIFEVVVDGDLSGGPFIFNPLLPLDLSTDRNAPEQIENYVTFSGNHAQNYHIFTPPVRNAWNMVWGGQPWIAEFPYSNHAYDFSFGPGESGDLVLEFWITPFDYAPFEGPEYAVESRLEEDKLIGLSWSVLDFDGDKRDGHYNLAHDVRMVKDASYLCAFRLMPMEPELQPDLKAEWSFSVIDQERRAVAFHDESIGEITSWKWDFGDGKTSTEQSPIHVFADKGIHNIITLEVSGPDGTSLRTRYRDVMVK